MIFYLSFSDHFYGKSIGSKLKTSVSNLICFLSHLSFLFFFQVKLFFATVPCCLVHQGRGISDNFSQRQVETLYLLFITSLLIEILFLISRDKMITSFKEYRPNSPHPFDFSEYSSIF